MFRKVFLTAVMTALMVGAVYAQATLKGRVSNEEGKPVDSVNIVLQQNGTVITKTLTDSNGNYKILSIDAGVYELHISCKGYASQRIRGIVLGRDTIETYDLILEKNKSVEFTREEMASPLDKAMVFRGGRAGTVKTRIDGMQVSYSSPQNTEEYKRSAENRFIMVQQEPLSTFSIDVDAASYSNMRRFINQGQKPPVDAIRTEELINYFTYEYEKPTAKDPVKITTETGICPWNEQHRLVRIGIKAQEIPTENLPNSNFVFLIDVSGSMEGANRLELVKSSLKLLVNNLREQDRVAIVVYAGAAGEVLPSTSGADKQKIKDALESLTAGGSTAGGAGIQLAYKIARKNFIENGNNRIILCTDGDFNVGISSPADLETLIETERKSGVFLTILGYGMGNYKDNRMQVLAQKGNGNHAYIDNLQEANKVLVNEFGGTLHTVAKDVKLQIEFNPGKVQAYRLVGYESRLLDKEDFNDDTKDAGEIGAGQSVTAFYEIIPVGVESSFLRKVDSLKYQKNKPSSTVEHTNSTDLLTVKLRYKRPQENESSKIEVPVGEALSVSLSEDFRFAAAVAMFGQLLKNSDFKGNATYDKVLSLAKESLGKDPQGYRREFVRLVEVMKGLDK